MTRFFTSESVTEGHPDKLCDQVSDAILDALLSQDPHSRVACEVATTTGLVLVMGEISTSGYASIEQVARGKVVEIGYDRAKYGFDGNTCAVIVTVDEQSSDIAMGVDGANGTGAGDQGMMFGYACDETEQLMPMPITLAHGLTRELAMRRKDKTIPYLRPDGKAQVTVEYEGGIPIRVDSVVVSAQHDPDIGHRQIEDDIIRLVIRAAIPERLLDERTRYFVNPTGRFVIGGPHGDSGLTGRKIIVDTYGGYARHGGGAFSGKDPTKVDRSASYAARHAAKNIVAAKLAKKCEVQVSYAIGVPEPVSLTVDAFGTGALPDDKLCDILTKTLDFRPAAITERLDLRRPIYAPTASYGHFGRLDLDLPWERADMAGDLLLKA